VISACERFFAWISQNRRLTRISGLERIPASERSREKLKALLEGQGGPSEVRSELVRLAARLMIEEALEGEAGDCAAGRLLHS
jgi:hypothetical protein